MMRDGSINRSEKEQKFIIKEYLNTSTSKLITEPDEKMKWNEIETSNRGSNKWTNYICDFSSFNRTNMQIVANDTLPELTSDLDLNWHMTLTRSGINLKLFNIIDHTAMWC